MPYRTEWVEPDLFMEHQGIKIFHCYKDNEMSERMTYWYVVINDRGDYGDDSDYAFDARDLPGWREGNDILACAKETIIDAIDAGLITEDGYQGNV